jgi:hypothetical protein
VLGIPGAQIRIKGELIAKETGVKPESVMRSAAARLAAAAGVALGAYTTYVALTWTRYGKPARPAPDEEDDLLDRFMPEYDVVERHRLRVDAPARITLEAAGQMDLLEAPLVRALFKARERLLGGTRHSTAGPRGLLEQMQSLGWTVLAEIPGREAVLGAVTKPWEANVVFRPIPPGEYRDFCEPGFVKIAWTLRADPGDGTHSTFRTETRAVATDARSRAAFRRYWALLSPGIILIRWMTLVALRREIARLTKRG